MNTQDYLPKAQSYLNVLCDVRPNRRVGSPGNRAATDFFARTMQRWGYALDTTSFACLDFASGEASLLECQGQHFDVRVSPFSLGTHVTATLETVSTVEELEACAGKGNILLLKGGLCAEQLMPKNFVFYNPDNHQRIYALLEEKRPAAIISATGRRPELVGAIYPFPLIEDGDFDIPSVYCADVVGEEIAARTGQVFKLISEATRIPATACNVLARKNESAPMKVVVCAHVDAWGDAPGALDNASGVVVTLLLAEMLEDYHGELGIEIVAFNGEDYYSAGGQMDYLRRYGGELESIVLAINVDGAGYLRGKTAYSLYECPENVQQKARAVFGSCAGMIEGEQWFQSDHMIFVQKGRPAIAITSEQFAEVMASITHSAKDRPDVVDCGKLVEVAFGLRRLIAKLP